MAMQEQQPRRRPQRRPRSKMRVFKEAYLPTIILCLTIAFIIIFIIGSASRKEEPAGPAVDTTPPQSSTADPQETLLQQEIQELLSKAAEFSRDYDYANALATLDTFSGNIAEYPEIMNLYNAYQAADASMVTWSASQVPNLAFHLLIADPDRAFPDGELGTSYQRNFITVNEFSAILQQLYDNGYILVGLDDLYTTQFDTTTGRDVYTETVLRLPEGKKPIMITEVNASYYTYMIDSDGNGLADRYGDGFASKLCYDGTKFYNEYVASDGSDLQGSYDMVPILEDFIAAHPDFSYRGARATVAFTGSDGILGHRISWGQAEKDAAATVCQALRDYGYTLACYTYDNVNYQDKSASQIQQDLQNWTSQIMSVIGQVDVLVFARDADISDSNPYEGSKFTVLHNAGFRYFMGVSSAPWNQVDDLYVRHDRLMLSGANLLNHPEWFAGLFDAASILDPARNNY